MQQFDDLLANRAKARHHNRAGPANGHGHALHFFQVGMNPHHNQNAAGLHPRVRSLGGGKNAAIPLANDRHAMLLAQVQFAQPFASQWASGVHPELCHTDLRAQKMHPFSRRADAGAGTRGQRGTEHMGRGKHFGGTNLDHGCAVKGVVCESIQRAFETIFTGQQRASCIGMVTRIANQRPRLLNP